MSNAKTIKFSGKGQAGNLLDPKNWGGGVVPEADDKALITINVGGPVSGTFSVNAMMLLGTEQITFRGTLNTAGVGACQGLMVCDGAVAIFAPGAVLNDGNVLIVGNDAVGTLQAEGSGSAHSVINSVDANIGKQDAGVGIFTIDDGIWKNSGHVVIGDDGAGTLNVIDNGSVVVGGDVDMAAGSGSSGLMTIAGGGSASVMGTLRVGGKASTGVASVNVGSGGWLGVNHILSVGAGSAVALAGGTIDVGSAGTGTAVGHVAIQLGGVIDGSGTLAVANGVPIEDGGIIRAAGGTLDVSGNISGKGSIQIASNSTVALSGSSLKLSSIAFIGADGTASLAHGADVTAAIAGFAVGDAIAMANIDAVSFNSKSGVLILSETNAQVAMLHLAGSFAGEMFTVQQQAGIGLIELHPG